MTGSTVVREVLALPTRFQSRIAPADSGCWEWTGAKTPDGYGLMRTGQGNQRRVAHRLVYELLVGPVPDGLQLDHLCRVRHCVNPEHLEPVTHRENHRRSEPANRTHCPQGHPYDDENTYWHPTRVAGRMCRACGRDRTRRRRQLGRLGLLEVPDGQHGTMNGHDYYGCRCDACRGAVAAYKRDWRRRKAGMQ